MRLCCANHLYLHNRFLYQMATVKAFIRVSKKDINRAYVRFRLSDGRKLQLFHVSNIEVIPANWDSKRQEIKAKIIINVDERLRVNNGVANLKTIISEIYNNSKDSENLTSEWLDIEIDKRLNPVKYEPKEQRQTFFEAFDEFLSKRKLSDVRKNNYRVVVRVLMRFELYVRATRRNSFVLLFDTITPLVLQNIEDFLRDEHLLAKQYSSIYEAVPESRPPKPRGQNTINDILSKIRSFFIWANDAKKTNNNPFNNYEIEESVYGTPYYINIEERNKLYHTDFSRRPALEKQRDIFVFQCLIGCRVADLYRFTKQNVINGAIEYIARKTKDGRPVTVRVPLNTIASEILAKYSDYTGKDLLPYISSQKYNEAIKEIFTIAGLTRPVIILDQLTRESIIRPLNEIASSHLARRCFVGNLYKQVKDPNLVGALSGHRDGSRAFARYREIDEEMKQELVKMLE